MNMMSLLVVKGADSQSCALCPGVWGIGVATQKVNLNQVPMGRDTNSLVLRSDGSVYHNNEEKNRLPANSLPQEGDIVVRATFIYSILDLSWRSGSWKDKKFPFFFLFTPRTEVPPRHCAETCVCAHVALAQADKLRCIS